MDKTATFYYENEVQWTGQRTGRLQAPGLPEVSVGAPPEFSGREGSWSPEHLLVAALNSCFMLTLLAIAENSKVPLVSFASSAKGTLEKVAGAGYQVTKIVLKPRVVVAASGDLSRMGRLLEKAKQNCFISNSIKSIVELEPEVFHQQTQTIPCPPTEAGDPKRSSTLTRS
jgi:peroxiredoxin-like protein